MRIFSKQWNRFIGRYPHVAARMLGELPLVSVPDRAAITEAPSMAIPAVVYQTWETRQLGKTHVREIETFRALNPEFDFVLLDGDQIDKFMETEFQGHPILNIYRNGKFGPLKTDIWRYCFIYKRGGFYFDINKGLKEPILKQLPKDTTGWICYETTLSGLYPPLHAMPWMQHPNNLLTNWGFAFTAGHPMLKKAIDLICDYYPLFAGKEFAQPKNAIIKLTGPGILTQAWHRYLNDIRTESDLATFCQGDIDFHRQAIMNMPRSWVRYAQLPAYARARNKIVVS